MHESSMHVKNLRNRAAFCRMVRSSFLMIFFGAGARGTSIRRQCDILSTSRFCKPSNIRIRASLFSVVHLRLSTFNFGRYMFKVEANKRSKGPMILSSRKFLQFWAISSMRYGGFAMLGIVRDSRSLHIRIALHIPVFFILFQAGITSRLSCGHLWTMKIVCYCQISTFL